MTIIVFSEFGGENLLGKARELGDASGEKVAALTSKGSSDKDQKLIFLGADEVLICDVKSVGEWISVISDYVKSDGSSRMIIFPLSFSSSAIMGAIYARDKGRFSPFLDGADTVELDSAARKIGTFNFALERKLISDKVALISLRTASVSKPFEDTSRYGEVRKLELIPSKNSFQILLDNSNSEEFTVLVGRGVTGTTAELAELVASKYRGRARQYSSRIEVVYGPCLAIEMGSKLRDLPEFNGELISISSRALPINSIADASAVIPELDAVLQGLLSY
ncbi:MAG: hypothetical protein OK439_01045 [Thaumarchaeota archaeon]|nr:hypothetical protein [Nitrososphaerota archaeon]